MRSKATILIILCLCLFQMAAGKEKNREWKTGKLINLDDQMIETGSLANQGTAIAVYKRKWVYTIDTGEYIYLAEETIRKTKTIKLTVNLPIKYALEKDDMFILDEENKEHKLKIEKKVFKEKQSPPN